MIFKEKKYFHVFIILCLSFATFILGMAYSVFHSGLNNHLHTAANSCNDANLGPGAQIIYIKYFTESDSYNITYSVCEARQTGMDITDAENEFKDWQVMYLDENKLILHKNIHSYGPQTYVVGTIKQNDTEFVCIYSYDDNGNRLIYSIFDTPVELLDAETAEELKNGITVKGKDNLLSAMEAFDE